jgi:predicted ATP-grasp superfamily ATP-dependent carboligase
MPLGMEQLLAVASSESASRSSTATAQNRRPNSFRGNSISSLRVLLCDEHYKHSLGIVRHLGKKGAQVSVLATKAASLACRSKFCAGIVPVASGTVAAAIESALEAVQSGRFDVILPVSLAMTLAAARRREEFRSHTGLEIADAAKIERAADKHEMAQLAVRCGVPVPKTIRAAEVGRLESELTFPVVIKAAAESHRRPPVRYAKSSSELRALLSGIERDRRPEHLNALIVQEFIPGYGCGFFATYQRGVCRRIFMHKRVREYPATGGVSTCAESFYDQELEQSGRKILDALDWHGVAMVEFRRDARDGRYKLIEVNPKFWGSLDLALAAGADFPGDLCRMAVGENLGFSGDYTRNLRFHWLLSGHGDLFHLWTRPQSLASVLLDCLNPRVKSNVWLGDLRPNLTEAAEIAARLFTVKKA